MTTSMRRSGGSGGFTFIEVVLAMVIMAAALVALSAVLTETTDRNISMEASNIAALLARDRMSQVMAQDFDNVVNVAATNCGGDFGQYTYTVSVDYVESDDLNTPVVGPTAYKRVIVEVAGLGNAFQLYDLKVQL